jgi:hypothetical protein
MPTASTGGSPTRRPRSGTSIAPCAPRCALVCGITAASSPSAGHRPASGRSHGPAGSNQMPRTNRSTPWGERAWPAHVEGIVGSPCQR